MREHAHMLQSQHLPSPLPSKDRPCSKSHLPGTTPWWFLVQGNTLPTYRVLPMHPTCSVGLLQPLAQSWLRLKTAFFCFKYLIHRPTVTVCWCGNCVCWSRQGQCLKSLSLSWLWGMSSELWLLGKEIVVGKEVGSLQKMGVKSLFYHLGLQPHIQSWFQVINKWTFYCFA